MENCNENKLSDKKRADLIDVVRTIESNGKDFASKLFQRCFFDVSETPDFMKPLGLSGEKFTISYGVISRHYDKDKDHNLSEQEWKLLPEAIQHPFAITKYFTDNSHKTQRGYRIYTSIKKGNGYVIAGVNVKAVNQGKNMPMLEINSISTVFGREKALSELESEIYRNIQITPEQLALLERPNSSQYPAGRE